MKTTLTWALLLAGAHVLSAAGANQILLRNLDPESKPAVVAADRAGHIFVLATLSAANGAPRATRVVEFDLTGTRLASVDVTQIASTNAAVADAQGNLILAGVDASYQGVVVKLEPQLQHAVFSRSLPGAVQAAAVDAAGNVYVTGATSSAAFPLTSDAYQTKAPVKNIFGSAAYAFLTEISASGDRLIYSSYFGDDAVNCVGGSSCLGAFGFTEGNAIALDSSGAVIVAGSTSAYKLPATPGALAGTCNCMYRKDAGFVAKFRPGAARQLEWFTFLNGDALTGASVVVKSLDLDTAGDVVVGGQAGPGLPTAAALQPSVDNIGGFAIKLNNAASVVIWGTYFGYDVVALRLDSQGRPLLTGTGVNPASSAPSPLAPYLARLAADGSAAVEYHQGPVGSSLAIASTGVFAALGQALWIETANPGPSLLSVVNSASGEYSLSIANAELITLYGIGLGPQTPAGGQVQDGAFTKSLGGVQVLFDGVAAPLLYAGYGQINAVVPRSVYAAPHLQVVTPSGTIDGPNVPVVYGSLPGIFTNANTGLAAAVNQDGSINSPANPARRGSVISLYATGIGSNYYADGAIVPIGIFIWNQPVWAVTDTRSLEIDFAGDAPGLVAGVTQINVRVPDPPPQDVTDTLTFVIYASGVQSQAITIAVAP